MEKTKHLFTQDCYEKYLSTINNVRFTNREIDVIACLLSARGTSKIASLLSVNTRTVETHVRNIMSKLDCNSREGIIDFIEASDRLPFVRKYYALLQNEMAFEKSLKEIAKANRGGGICCSLIQEKEVNPFISYLQFHLALAGITVSTAAREKKGNYTLFVLPKFLTEAMLPSLLTKIEKSQNKVLLVLQERKKLKEIPQELTKWDLIDFAQQENYFFAFFLLLEKLLPNINLDKIVAQFKDKYKKDTTHYESLPTLSPEKLPEKRKILERWAYYLSACSFLAILGIGFFIFSWNQKNNEMDSVRSDLVIPVESAFLNRSELITKINNAFKAKEGIQSIALIGMGGAGKTTLARQYAYQQQADIVWEINAETNGSLNESFDNLASALSKTEEDKKSLRDLKELQNSHEREKKLIIFVKEQLKLHKNWFLIYDNVENFTDIQSYFPLDVKTWGTGKLIITTRDGNFQNNKYVNYTLHLGELDQNQKLDLFTKIMIQGSKNSFTPAQRLEAKLFLEKIPPFPLDVSAAAYYLKATNVSYKKYLENLEEYNQDFARVQENLLKEAGSYIKTRYGIISFSLKQLIKSHQDFEELLLFISLLDSQNIPRDLLNTYKDSTIVDDFIHHLKKYSLLTDGFSTPSELSFSIHRSAQDISLVYLTESLKLTKNSQALKSVINVLGDYIDQIIEQEDVSRMHIIAPHLEKILNHVEILEDFAKGLLESKLGSIYYFINDSKARKMLEDSLIILQKKALEPLSSLDASRLARSLLHIGAVYTELRLDREAKDILEKAVALYRKEGPKHYADLSWALSYLGNIHRKLGNYEKARSYLEESIQLHKQYGTNQKRIARTLAYLGGTHRGLGSYQKSVDILQESLAFYKKHYSKDHFRVGWILIQLGNVYRDLGNYQKAKGFLEDGLLIFKKHLSDNHVSIGLALAYLGNCHRELGDYKKSRDYLEQSLNIYQKHFDEQHEKTGWLLFHLASTYKALGQRQEAQKLYKKILKIYINYCGEDNVEKGRLLRNMARVYLEQNLLNEAENSATQSLRIFQSYGHIETFRALKMLGEILLKKSAQLSRAQKIQGSQMLRAQALDKFKEALKITKQYFPEESPPIQKIEKKIKEITKKN